MLKYFTYEEYRELIKESQTDKEGNLIYLYANNTEEQFSYIEAAKAKGYSVLLLDGQLDVPLVGLLEQKFEKSRFTRVDADVIDRLIAKENNAENALTPQETERLAMVFKAEMPHTEKTEFQVEVQSMGESALPVIITQSEYMRRMKEMSRIQPGMAFYGEMPDMYNFIVNADHPVVKAILADANAQLNNTLAPVEAELKGLEARHTALESAFKDKKEEKISADDREMLKQCNDSISEQKQKEKEIFSAYARGNRTISQLLDIALLQNGQLKGAALDKFIKRSIDMIK